jgi:hypothetical protein
MNLIFFFCRNKTVDSCSSWCRSPSNEKSECEQTRSSSRTKRNLSHSPSPGHKSSQKVTENDAVVKPRSRSPGVYVTTSVPHKVEKSHSRKYRSRTPPSHDATASKSSSKSPNRVKRKNLPLRMSRSRTPQITSKDSSDLCLVTQSVSSSSVLSSRAPSQKVRSRKSRSCSRDESTRRNRSVQKSRSRSHSAHSSGKRILSSRRSRSHSPRSSKVKESSGKCELYSRSNSMSTSEKSAIPKSISPSRSAVKRNEQSAKHPTLSHDEAKRRASDKKSSACPVGDSTRRKISPVGWLSASPARSDKMKASSSSAKVSSSCHVVSPKISTKAETAPSRSQSGKQSSSKNVMSRKSASQSPKGVDKNKKPLKRSRSRSPSASRHKTKTVTSIPSSKSQSGSDKLKTGRLYKSRSRSPRNADKTRNKLSAESKSGSPSNHSRTKASVLNIKSGSRSSCNVSTTRSSSGQKTGSRSFDKHIRLETSTSKKSRSPLARSAQATVVGKMTQVKSAKSCSSSSYSSQSSSESDSRASRSRSRSSESPVSVAKLNRPYAVGLAAELRHRRTKILELSSKEKSSSQSTPQNGVSTQEAIVIDDDDHDSSNSSNSRYFPAGDKISSDSDEPTVVDMSTRGTLKQLQERLPVTKSIPTASIPLPPGPKRAPWSANKHNEMVTTSDANESDIKCSLPEKTADVAAVATVQCSAAATKNKDEPLSQPLLSGEKKNVSHTPPVSLIKLPLPPVVSDSECSDSSDSEDSPPPSKHTSPPRYPHDVGS